MEGHDAPGRGRRLPEIDVGDGSGAGEDADAAASPASEMGHRVDDVGARGHLEHVGSEGVGAVSGDDDRGLGLVLRPGWTASGPPTRRGAGVGAGGGGIWVGLG